jgi:hypothetical protein
MIIQILCYQIWSGSISGEINYSGTAEGEIFIAVFANSSFDGDPIYVVTINSPQNYTIDNVADGTYYIGAVKTTNIENIKYSDPYGFYGNENGLIPVIVSGNNDVDNINLILVDGTIENPNPFAVFYAEPNEIISLSDQIINGSNSFLFKDDSNLFLYIHDYEGAPSATIYELNLNDGSVINTIHIDLESTPNRISWMDKIVMRNGELWAIGGYGNPDGSGGKEGIFKINLQTSNSSSQIPIELISENINNLTSDGTFFYVIYSGENKNGIIKFNPDLVATVPSDLFIDLNDQRARYLTYGNNFLWVGINRLSEFNPINGDFIGSFELPAFCAEIFFDNKFLSYQKDNNEIWVYNYSLVSVDDEKNKILPQEFYLYQNYPNPFNPTTTIKYSIPSSGNITLQIFNSLGELIQAENIYQGNPGLYEFKWNSENRYSSGTYLYRVNYINENGKSYSSASKMILLK